MQNALGAIQKLSIRKKASSIMIKQSLIEWTLKILENYKELKEYTLEYVAAVLINLTLRTEGRKKCENLKLRVLNILKPLIEHPSSYISSQINGTIYSILDSQILKEEAKVY